MPRRTPAHMSNELSAVQQATPALDKKRSRSTDSFPDKEGAAHVHDSEAQPDRDEEGTSWFSRHHLLVHRVVLISLAALILGWWVSATILTATRHRWIVQTLFAWFFLAIIAFRFIPNSVVTRPVEAVWVPVVQKPFFALPRSVRLAMGWGALLAIVFGSAFGFKATGVRPSCPPFFLLRSKSLSLSFPRTPTTVIAPSPSLGSSSSSSDSTRPRNIGPTSSGMFCAAPAVYRRV